MSQDNGLNKEPDPIGMVSVVSGGYRSISALFEGISSSRIMELTEAINLEKDL